MSFFAAQKKFRLENDVDDNIFILPKSKLNLIRPLPVHVPVLQINNDPIMSFLS